MTQRQKARKGCSGHRQVQTSTAIDSTGASLAVVTALVGKLAVVTTRPTKDSQREIAAYSESTKSSHQASIKASFSVSMCLTLRWQLLSVKPPTPERGRQARRAATGGPLRVRAADRPTGQHGWAVASRAWRKAAGGLQSGVDRGGGNAGTAAVNGAKTRRVLSLSTLFPNTAQLKVGLKFPKGVTKTNLAGDKKATQPKN